MTSFAEFDGPVEAPYIGSDSEILEDLLAVIEAVGLKPVRLTKSGIPPKPLWTAINNRLIWSDPSGILYDWEEADQVRFVYRLALGLDLIRPDPELWLTTGPSAGPFFFADGLTRARMILRAYLALWDWDERCDARNEEGHRHNFGQAFRRDFVHDVTRLREEAIALLPRMPDTWTDLAHLARAFSGSLPDALISEVCKLPELPEDGIDPEKLRFLRYWFSLLGRFGWAALARSNQGGETRRIGKLTPLGAALFKNAPHKEPSGFQIQVDDTLEIHAVDDKMPPSARFFTRILGEQVETPRGKPSRFRISEQSVARAARDGVDLTATLVWLERWGLEGVPVALDALVQEVLSTRAAVRITRCATAIELGAEASKTAKALEKTGFGLNGSLALAAGRHVPSLFEALGGEPEEGFDYPPEEPLAVWSKKGLVLQLYYEELPLIHRDLLRSMDPSGDPQAVVFDADKVGDLAEAGWTPESLCKALEKLTLKTTPARIASALASMFP